MLSHQRTLIFVFVVSRLFFVHCLQPGHANLGGCLKFFAGLDFEEIMSKKASATLTGRMLRNQLYYEFATFAGVKGAGNNVAAPQYIVVEPLRGRFSAFSPSVGPLRSLLLFRRPMYFLWRPSCHSVASHAPRRSPPSHLARPPPR